MQLERPIAFLDIETSSLDKQKGHILEISVLKLLTDLTTEPIKTMRFNPGEPIPAESTAIHGITDADVADKPFFKQVAGSLLKYLEGCDIGGFSSNQFDVPFLYNEFYRCGIEWDYTKFRMIDAGVIFKRKDERTLAAAYQKYCGKTLENAHSAEADIKATVDVFLAQVELYKDDEGFPKTIDEMNLYCNFDRKLADVSGNFVYDEKGTLILNIGKEKGKPASSPEGKQFVFWMYNKANFPNDTRKICAQVLGVAPKLF